MKQLAFLLTFALLALACDPAEKPAEEPAPEPEAEAEAPAAEPAAEMIRAQAVLHNAEGAEIGTATFTQNGEVVILLAEVRGVERDGPHGFHVHEVGECVPPDFKAAGGHFNPEGTGHACPPNPERHGGDFGNIEIVEGRGRLEIPSELVTVFEGPRSVIGRAVILHAGVDDCVGQPTGDAGSRLACGLAMPAGDEAEMDQQHEHHVDQRRDVDLRHLPTRWPRRLEPPFHLLRQAWPLPSAPCRPWMR